MKRCQNYRITPVQTIGQENITTTKLCHSKNFQLENFQVFIHGKINNSNHSIDVIVRSKDLQLSQSILNVLQTIVV